MKNESEIYAHIRNENGKWKFQSNEEHQRNVSRLAADFAADFGMSEWGEILGLLHDKGKEQLGFQQHLFKESGYKPNISVSGEYLHAYVGGLIINQLYPKTYPLAANIIMGHHRGLYDADELRKNLGKEIPIKYSEEGINFNQKLPKVHFESKDLHHLERMLFSCLVDADYLDTEAFMQPQQKKARGNEVTMQQLLERLEEKLKYFKVNSKNTEVNKIRNYVQDECIKKSGNPIGIYSLTVPTGGGKTLASVLWALQHAIKNDLKRIIIAIPYTSIIEQTAAILKDIFGEENVLEHHSDFDSGAIKNKVLQEKLKLATENWDYPIIVTTNVQLFESLFSNKPSKCRKLHNLSKSVIILDEVQTLPTEFLQPIVDTFDTLKRVFGISILFTTASQPVLTGVITGTNPNIQLKGLENINEIIPKEANLHTKLKRVELHIDDTAKTYDEVAESIKKYSKVLCVVNTRKDAKELYNRLPEDGIKFHLSRMMCPCHVKATIKAIKENLGKEKEETIRVISTQLIEAGVDIDFPVVYRQQAGLDSVLQAAGRCNREGNYAMGQTYVFSLGNLPKGHITQANNARMSLKDTEDWFNPATMADYFRQFYCRTSSFDKEDIKGLLYNMQDMQMETACNKFKLIDDDSYSIIVQYKNSKELVEQLNEYGPNYRLMKQLSQYIVNIHKQDFKQLQEAGVLNEIGERMYVLPDSSYYHEDVGLVTDNHWLEEIQIL